MGEAVDSRTPDTADVADELPYWKQGDESVQTEGWDQPILFTSKKTGHQTNVHLARNWRIPLWGNWPVQKRCLCKMTFIISLGRLLDPAWSQGSEAINLQIQPTCTELPISVLVSYSKMLEYPGHHTFERDENKPQRKFTKQKKSKT